MRIQAISMLQPVEQPTTEEETNKAIAWFQEHVNGSVFEVAGRKFKIDIYDYDEDAPEPETYFIACGDCEKTFHKQSAGVAIKATCPECGSRMIVTEREGQ